MVENKVRVFYTVTKDETGKILKKKSCEEKKVAVHIICPGSMKYPRKKKWKNQRIKLTKMRH